MKKILLRVVVLFFSLTISISINAQTVCAGLQTEIENTEKQVVRLNKKKLPLEDFFSLMEDPKSGVNSLSDELADVMDQIKELQKGITGGDNSAETAADLQSLRARAELMNLRMSKNFNQNSFLKHPKYIQVEKSLWNLKSEEQNLKNQIAGLGLQMSENKCPPVVKKPTDDDLEISTKLDDKKENAEEKKKNSKEEINWKGAYTDGISTMTVSGGSGSLSISWAYAVGDASGNGSLNCSKIEGNKASGKWTAQHDDITKSGSRSGTFTLTLDGNTMTGKLLEDTPKWSYKPGYNAANVKSKMFKDAEWPFTVTRK